MTCLVARGVEPCVRIAHAFGVVYILTKCFGNRVRCGSWLLQCLYGFDEGKIGFGLSLPILAEIERSVAFVFCWSCRWGLFGSLARRARSTPSCFYSDFFCSCGSNSFCSMLK